MFVRASPPARRLASRLCCLLTLLGVCAQQAAAREPGLAGSWVFNQELSDVTDRKVEEALRAAGQPVRRRLFDSRRDRYRGGPEEQELYDRISYDRSLAIELEGETYLFTYDEGWTREVHTGDQRRSVSLNALDELEDYSFADWQGDKLLVEARPRDGGFAEESYELVENGTRLRVELYIKPRAFTEPIELTRVYERAAGR